LNWVTHWGSRLIFGIGFPDAFKCKIIKEELSFNYAELEIMSRISWFLFASLCLQRFVGRWFHYGYVDVSSTCSRWMRRWQPGKHSPGRELLGTPESRPNQKKKRHYGTLTLTGSSFSKPAFVKPVILLALCVLRSLLYLFGPG